MRCYTDGFPQQNRLRRYSKTNRARKTPCTLSWCGEGSGFHEVLAESEAEFESETVETAEYVEHSYQVKLARPTARSSNDN
jgi:hypothetical protein